MQRHPLDQPFLGQSLLGVPELTSLPSKDPASDAALRVLVVAEDPVVRSAFAQRLLRHSVGEATPGQVAVAVKRTSANVVLWDLGPSDTPVAALGEVTVPVVVLTSADGAAGRLLARGAQGVLRRDAGPDAIASALGVARHGLQVVDPSLARGAGVFGEPRHAANEAPTESLTPREVQVLELVATGMSNKQIARDLGISAHTVKFHINAILAKLDVHTRTQAVVRGVQLGVMTV